jgi:hypothetical protein
MSGSGKPDPTIRHKGESHKNGSGMVEFLTRKTNRLSTGGKALYYGHLQKTDSRKQGKSTLPRIGLFDGNPVKTC